MKTILFVDDESPARYGMRRALEGAYRIAEADSAESARTALTADAPDLILLDVVMPGEDGLSFLRWLREGERELRNAIERSMVLSASEEITLQDLPEEIRRGPAGAHGPGENSIFSPSDFREARRKFEIAFLQPKLEENHWNVSRTTAEIGLHRQSLQEKLREPGIQRPGK